MSVRAIVREAVLRIRINGKVIDLPIGNGLKGMLQKFSNRELEVFYDTCHEQIKTNISKPWIKLAMTEAQRILDQKQQSPIRTP